ncbi:glucuronate isomerase [Brooklawnia cerclae]|uniref:Uronate isomerase n=1 Tax=Brooklawnia cerclae TaxID=349934 RepID=A0ABX0SG39_9ACTN|nr:glucuronate isomerase [Brooklawnia cerclae]NIH57348.1 glucuronate isomerase [Brooklawnia cerclae]
MAQLSMHDDRLFPADDKVRGIARRIYAETRDLPIISPHGHVPPAWIADNLSFENPTKLLLTPDHYINRVLHANGAELSELGVGREDMDEADNRRAFRLLCEHWSDFNGTAMRYWLTDQLVGLFGVTQRPSAETADAIYDTIQAWIDDETHRPRALMDQFRIEFIATTDDPCDDLHDHEKLAADAAFSATHRVAPTFRPDKYLEPDRADWNERADRLAQVTGIDTGTLAGFTAALESRRAYFKQHGAVSTDHGLTDLEAGYLDAQEAERLFGKARGGGIAPEEATALRRHLLMDQVRMATEDGLTMTLHPGALRDHDRATFEKYGQDVGCDIPYAIEVTRSTREMLNAFGNHPNLNLVIFTLDEDVYSREIAPLAGFYRSVYIGVPWWFIDAPESILRFKQAITEMGGFSRVSGMIDDTRAFCSIPARHDMMRRLDAVHLAGLVAVHRLDEDEAIEQAGKLVVDNPKKVFKL